MSLDGDNHASSHTNSMRTRKSMDAEIHNALDSESPDALSETMSQLSLKLPSRDSDSESDDDSFGEASAGREPDREFLEQVLEECHPERLNLLDRTVPESVYKKGPGLFSQENKDSEAGPGRSNLEKTGSMRQIETKDGSQGSDVQNDETDTFQQSPRKFRRREDNNMLGALGNSTKKSLRTINGTFWAKPFNGLSQSLRRNGKDGELSGS